MSRTPTWTRPLAFLAGCVIAVGFVVSGEVAESDAQAGAAVQVRTGSFSELSVAQSGEVLSVRNLLPGRPAKSRLAIWNPTDVTLAVRPRLVFRRELPRGLEARIRVDGDEVFSGPVEGLSHGGRRDFKIRSNERQKISLEISVRESAAPGMRYSSRSARFDLLTRVDGA